MRALVSALLVLIAACPALCFEDLPAREIPLGGLAGAEPGDDSQALMIGLPDGRGVLVTLEGEQVFVRPTRDGGASFGEETLLYGARPIQHVWGDVAADGTVYVALEPRAYDVDRPLLVVTGWDGGASWSDPVVAAIGGAVEAPSPRALCLDVATGPDGAVAIAFQDDGGRIRVTSSVDRGRHWTGSGTVDTGGVYTSRAYEVTAAVDAAGAIHVFSTRASSGAGLYYARSTDGGATFGAETRLASGSPRYPDAAIAGDGALLVAYQVGQQLVVLRSADGGATFQQTWSGIVNVNALYYPPRPRLFVAPGTATLLLATVEPVDVMGTWSPGRVRVWRSGDAGVTFGAAAVMTETAYWSGVVYPTDLVHGARTPAGNWVIAWSDTSKDAFGRDRGEVWARSSADDGATFGAPARVDDGPVGTFASALAGLVVAAPDEVLVVYRDARLQNGRTANVHANRAPAASLAFAGDARVDVDHTTGHPPLTFGALAADAGHVYVAAYGLTWGPLDDLVVWSSGDGGATYGPARRATGDPAGSRVFRHVSLATAGDGPVYALSTSTPDLLANEVRVARSLDFGETWSDALLGSVSPASWAYLALTAEPAGLVLAAWSGDGVLRIGRSVDAGTTYTVDTLSGADPATGRVAICSRGSLATVVYEGRDISGSASIFARVTLDGGATWLAPQRLGWGTLPRVACGDAVALATWQDSSSGPIESARFASGAWGAARSLGYGVRAVPAFTSATDLVVAWTSGDWPGRVAHSADAGVTFDPAVDIVKDGATLDYTAVVSDRAGGVWIGYHDRPDRALVVHSSDGGRTFGPTRRPATAPIALAYDAWYDWSTPMTAQPGRAILGWTRTQIFSVTYPPDVLVNTWDIADFDRDRAPDATDCDDADPGVFSAPLELGGLTVSGPGTRVAWTPQAEAHGPATVADLATGGLGALLATGGFGEGACLAAAVPGAGAEDTRPDPEAGDGAWYLVRGRNACGTGTYGDATLAPDPRDALDAASPCP